MFGRSSAGRPTAGTCCSPGCRAAARAALHRARQCNEARVLTDTSAWSSWGAWSPDGRHIAYTAKVDSANAIFVMNADGSGARRITTGSSNETGPRGRRTVPGWRSFPPGAAARRSGPWIRMAARSRSSATRSVTSTTGVVARRQARNRVLFPATVADSIGVVNADGSAPPRSGPAYGRAGRRAARS